MEDHDKQAVETLLRESDNKERTELLIRTYVAWRKGLMNCLPGSTAQEEAKKRTLTEFARWLGDDCKGLLDGAIAQRSFDANEFFMGGIDGAFLLSNKTVYIFEKDKSAKTIPVADIKDYRSEGWWSMTMYFTMKDGQKLVFRKRGAGPKDEFMKALIEGQVPSDAEISYESLAKPANATPGQEQTDAEGRESLCPECGSTMRVVLMAGQASGQTLCLSCHPADGSCPICGGALRTQKAQQCPHCKGSWHRTTLPSGAGGTGDDGVGNLEPVTGPEPALAGASQGQSQGKQMGILGWMVMALIAGVLYGAYNSGQEALQRLQRWIDGPPKQSAVRTEEAGAFAFELPADWKALDGAELHQAKAEIEAGSREMIERYEGQGALTPGFFAFKTYRIPDDSGWVICYAMKVPTLTDYLETMYQEQSEKMKFGLDQGIIRSVSKHEIINIDGYRVILIDVVSKDDGRMVNYVLWTKEKPDMTASLQVVVSKQADEQCRTAVEKLLTSVSINRPFFR